MFSTMNRIVPVVVAPAGRSIGFGAPDETDTECDGWTTVIAASPVTPSLVAETLPAPAAVPVAVVVYET